MFYLTLFAIFFCAKAGYDSNHDLIVYWPAVTIAFQAVPRWVLGRLSESLYYDSKMTHFINVISIMEAINMLILILTFKLFLYAG